jgi:hypothetical protein
LDGNFVELVEWSNFLWSGVLSNMPYFDRSSGKIAGSICYRQGALGWYIPGNPGIRYEYVIFCAFPLLYPFLTSYSNLQSDIFGYLKELDALYAMISCRLMVRNFRKTPTVFAH